MLGVENNFRTNVQGPVRHGERAQGPAQVMPSTAAVEAGKYGQDPKKVLTDPYENIKFGVAYLGTHLDKYGNAEDALRAYNAGPHHIQESHNYPETNQYVKDIGVARDAYAKNLAPQLASLVASRRPGQPEPDQSRPEVDPATGLPSIAPASLASSGGSELAAGQPPTPEPISPEQQAGNGYVGGRGWGVPTDDTTVPGVPQAASPRAPLQVRQRPGQQQPSGQLATEIDAMGDLAGVDGQAGGPVHKTDQSTKWTGVQVSTGT